MWIIAIVGSASAFVESTLAQIYKKKGEDGRCYGGPAYYIEAALHSRPLGDRILHRNDSDICIRI